MTYLCSKKNKVMKKDFTFNQIAAAGLAVLILICLMLVYFFPREGSNEVTITGSLTGAFGICIMFLMKAGSDAKNEAAQNRMIDAMTGKPKEQIVTPE